MKKNNNRIAGIIVLSLLLLSPFVVLLLGDYMNDIENEKFEACLTDYSPNPHMAAVVDSWSVHIVDQDLYVDSDNESVLFLTESELFFSELSDDKKTLTVYRADFELRKTLVFQKYFENKNPYAVMYDEKCIFVNSGNGYYSYDIETKEYKFCGETNDAVSEYCNKLSENVYSCQEQGELYTVTRISDNVSKSFKITDIIAQSPIAAQLNNISKLNTHAVYIEGNRIFVSCFGTTQIVMVYEYDFEAEKFSFYSWRKVEGIDGLELFFFDED